MMIKVTIWNEFVQEQLDEKVFDFTEKWVETEDGKRFLAEKAKAIKAIHGAGIHETLKNLV